LGPELPTPATDHAVYSANAFFVGLPIPVMSPVEELLLRRTYFVLPAAVPVPQGAHRRQARHAVGRARAGEHVKGDGGTPLIRVPESIKKVITCDDGDAPAPKKAEQLCNMPEPKRHYAQLEGWRNQPWAHRYEKGE